MKNRICFYCLNIDEQFRQNYYIIVQVQTYIIYRNSLLCLFPESEPYFRDDWTLWVITRSFRPRARYRKYSDRGRCGFYLILIDNLAVSQCWSLKKIIFDHFIFSSQTVYVWSSQPTMKQQRMTQFYRTAKKIKDLLEMKMPCFKKKFKADKERSKNPSRSISKISRSKKIGEQKSSQDFPVEVFNQSLGPDFKIYEFDDFLVNCPDDQSSSPAPPPPPLPPRYSACPSVPPPVFRRTILNYN